MNFPVNHTVKHSLNEDQVLEAVVGLLRKEKHRSMERGEQQAEYYAYEREGVWCKLFFFFFFCSMYCLALHALLSNYILVEMLGIGESDKKMPLSFARQGMSTI